MLTMFPKFELVPMSRYFITFPNARRPARMPWWSTSSPRFVEQDVGGLARDVNGSGDGDADVGGVERRSVVDAVPDEPHDVPAALEREEDARLLGGRGPGEHGRSLGDVRQCGVGHPLDLRTEDDATAVDAQRPAHVGGHGGVVAAEDLQRDAVPAE